MFRCGDERTGFVDVDLWFVGYCRIRFDSLALKVDWRVASRAQTRIKNTGYTAKSLHIHGELGVLLTEKRSRCL